MVGASVMEDAMPVCFRVSGVRERIGSTNGRKDGWRKVPQAWEMRTWMWDVGGLGVGGDEPRVVAAVFSVVSDGVAAALNSNENSLIARDQICSVCTCTPKILMLDPAC